MGALRCFASRDPHGPQAHVRIQGDGARQGLHGLLGSFGCNQ
jgi:hypothetical protein